MAEIKGRKIDLPGERSVFVGQKEGADDYYVELKNGTDATRFRISKEAKDALWDVLSGYGEPHTVHAETVTGARWQLVKPEEA